MKTSKKILLLLCVPAALAIITVHSCTPPPKSFKEVKHPREGSAINRRVALVYCLKYRVSMAGFEKLHPHPQKHGRIYLELNSKGHTRPGEYFVPRPLTREQVLTVHSERFLNSLKDPRKVAKYLEMPPVGIVPAKLVDAGILSAFRYQSGGTILAARLALRHGIAINLGGGFHHAKRDRGEGFNVYNDLAIAIKTLLNEGLVKRVLVVDLDVHQGNGTAEIFAGDDSVFTFSMHQGNIYPVPKARSDLDIELRPGIQDGEYIERLTKALPEVFRASRPEIVFFQAGADTMEGDKLAGLNMTRGGIVRRDSVVIDGCAARRIPVVMTLGGGYSAEAWRAQYRSISRTIRKYGAATPRYAPRKPSAKERAYTK